MVIKKNKMKKKLWYRINKDVEYSTDFKFFRENQIYIVKSGKRYTFCSRLEAKQFLKINALSRNGELDAQSIDAHCKGIHEDILAGKHGKGKLVD